MTALTRAKAFARAAWTRSRALAHPTIQHASEAAGVDASHLSRWESERADHPVPLAVLYLPTLVDDAAFERIIADAREVRAAHAVRDLCATPVGTLKVAATRMTESLATIVDVIGDGRVTADERPRTRKVLDAVAGAIDRARRSLDDADRADHDASGRRAAS